MAGKRVRRLGMDSMVSRVLGAGEGMERGMSIGIWVKKGMWTNDEKLI